MNFKRNVRISILIKIMMLKFQRLFKNQFVYYGEMKIQENRNHNILLNYKHIQQAREILYQGKTLKLRGHSENQQN